MFNSVDDMYLKTVEIERALIQKIAEEIVKGQ